MSRFIHIHVGGSHAEELALERHAVLELEREAEGHWKAGRYAASQEALLQLAAARKRVHELEREERA